jgi:type IV secretory pathway TraG/TraD family ATPase VirD4
MESKNYASLAGGSVVLVVSMSEILIIFALSQLPSLGHCEAIQDIGPEGRKRGIRLLAVVQDLEGLQRVYPKSWRGFLNNADARVFMSTADKATIDYIAQSLGTATHKEKVDAGGLASLFSRIMIRGQKVERTLLCCATVGP